MTGFYGARTTWKPVSMFSGATLEIIEEKK
jgi:hypothetical protein